LLFRAAGPRFGVWLAPCICDSRDVLAHLQACLSPAFTPLNMEESAAPVCRHPRHATPCMGSSEPKRRPPARQAYQLTLAGFEALGGATQLTSLSIDHLQACLAITQP